MLTTAPALSGTPSSLLPLEMGDCVYAQGDDGKMLRALTDPRVVSIVNLGNDWTVDGLVEVADCMLMASLIR